MPTGPHHFLLTKSIHFTSPPPHQFACYPFSLHPPPTPDCSPVPFSYFDQKFVCTSYVSHASYVPHPLLPALCIGPVITGVSAQYAIHRCSVPRILRLLPTPSSTYSSRCPVKCLQFLAFFFFNAKGNVSCTYSTITVSCIIFFMFISF